MSKEALVKVIQRSISDPTFRRQLATDASGALRGYDLTADEIGAMRSRDAAKLTAFGVDTRMSKAFSVFDPGSTGSATVSSGSEPRDVAPVWIGDNSSALPAHTYSGDDNAGPAAEVATGSEPRDVAPTWIGDNSSPLSVHTYSGDDNAGPAAEVATGSEPRDVAPTWIGDNSVAADGYATDEGQLTNGNMGDAHIQISTGDGDLDQ